MQNSLQGSIMAQKIVCLSESVEIHSEILKVRLFSMVAIFFSYNSLKTCLIKYMVRIENNLTFNSGIDIQLL